MSENVVLYCEKLPTEGMETLIMELCPPELDLRFLYPVKNGKKGDFEDANYILASICKIGKAEIDRAKGLKLDRKSSSTSPPPATTTSTSSTPRARASPSATRPARTPPPRRSSPSR